MFPIEAWLCRFVDIYIGNRGFNKLLKGDVTGRQWAEDTEHRSLLESRSDDQKTNSVVLVDFNGDGCF